MLKMNGGANDIMNTNFHIIKNNNKFYIVKNIDNDENINKMKPLNISDNVFDLLQFSSIRRDKINKIKDKIKKLDAEEYKHKLFQFQSKDNAEELYKYVLNYLSLTQISSKEFYICKKGEKINIINEQIFRDKIANNTGKEIP